MKNMNKKSLILALVAASLLTGCDDDTTINKVNNGPVATVAGNNTYLDKAGLYDQLKSANAGTTSLDKIIETIAKLEYDDVVKADATVDATVDGNYNVKQYRTNKRFLNEIKEKFQTILDNHSYADEDGDFDENKYIEYIEDTLDYEVTDETPKYALPAGFTKNYDAYIEGEIIPELYKEYIYEDYVLQNTGRTSSFQSQKAMTFDVLKINNDTTKENAAFTEALVKVVKAVTGNTEIALNAADILGLKFNAVDSKYNLISISAEADKVYYKNYGNVEDDYMEVYNRDGIKDVDAITPAGEALETIVIDATSNDSEENMVKFYKAIEKIQIARDLHDIDVKVVKARNYDFKNAEYRAYLSSEQDEAKSLADTFSSSNARSILKGAKIDKISAQQTKYYTEEATYTSSEYTSVLPSSIYNLRESSAREFYGNLTSYSYGDTYAEQYLLPKKENQTSPVYLDSSDYYVCNVDAYYGLYLLAPSKSINESGLSTPTDYIYKSDWEITAYRAGEYKAYSYADSKWSASETATKVITEIQPDGSLLKGGVIDLVSTSVKQIVSSSSAIKKEAIVALFEKYGLEINDQDVYDYIKGEYPAYFEED